MERVKYLCLKMCQVDFISEKHQTSYSMIVYRRNVQISGLLPFTIYTVAIRAFLNNTKLLTGPSCYVIARTSVGGTYCVKLYRMFSRYVFCVLVPPAPRKPQLALKTTQTENTVVLNLPALNETNGPIRLTM